MIETSLLAENKRSLLKEWKALLLEVYPEDSRRFFQKEKDHFANPVGSILLGELEKLLNLIVEDKQGPEMEDCLDKILRIRAVHDLRPSQALGFIFGLKDLVRRVLAPSGSLEIDFRDLDQRIEKVALLALDIYWNIKKQLQDLRVVELKRYYERLLVRAKVLAEIPDQDPVIQ